MLRTAVPEASVHEYGNSLACEDDIWAGIRAGGADFHIHAKPQSASV
jgi:hypothetical protein